MTDLAKLTISINTSGAKQAAANLGEVKSAALKADEAVRDLGSIDDSAFNKLANALTSLQAGGLNVLATNIETARTNLSTALKSMAGEQTNSDKVKGFLNALGLEALETATALELLKTASSGINLGKAAGNITKFNEAAAKVGSGKGGPASQKGLDSLQRAIGAVGSQTLETTIALEMFQQVKINDDVDAMTTAFREFREEGRLLFRDINRISKVLGKMPGALAPIKTAFDQMATSMAKTRDASDGLGRRLGSIETNAKKLDESADVATEAMKSLETAFDNSTDAAGRFKNSLRGSSTSSSQAVGRTRAFQQELAKIRGSANSASAGLKRTTRDITIFGNASRVAGNFAKQFATGLGLIGGGFAAALGLRGAISTLSDFEFSLQSLQAVAIDANATFSDQINTMAALEAQARQLGAATRFTAAETADAQLFLARAGFEANEILAATPATLDLAAAGMLDLGNAADIASNVLQQFSLDAGQLSQVADDLVSAANNSNTTVEQLAAALAYAGPFASSLGITVNEAAAAIGALGNAGIKSTLAGTNFRGILVALTKPTKEASDTMDVLARRLGTTREAFDITKRSVEEVFQSFADANASSKELANIFNRRNVSGAQAFITQIDSLKELNETLSDNTGEARRAADIVDNSLRGAYRRAVSAVQEFVLVQGDQGLKGALRGVIDAAADAFRVLSGTKSITDDLADGAKGLVFTMKALAGAFVGLGLGVIVSGFTSLATAIVGAATAATGLGGVLAAVATAFPPLLIASIAGAVVGLGLAFFGASDDVRNLVQEADELEQKFKDLTPVLSTVGDAVQKAFSLGEDDDPTKRITAAANAIQQIDDALNELGSQRGGNLEGADIPVRMFADVEAFAALGAERADIFGQAFLDNMMRNLDVANSEAFARALSGANTVSGMQEGLNRIFNKLDVTPGLARVLTDAASDALVGDRLARISKEFGRLAEEGAIDASRNQLSLFGASLQDLIGGSGANIREFADNTARAADIISRAARTANVNLTREQAEMLATMQGMNFDDTVFRAVRDAARNLEDLPAADLPLEIRVGREEAVAELQKQRAELVKMRDDALDAAKKVEEAIAAQASDDVLQQLLDERDARFDALQAQGLALKLSKEQAVIERAIQKERATLSKVLNQQVNEGGISRTLADQILADSEAQLRLELEKQAALRRSQKATDDVASAYERLSAKYAKATVNQGLINDNLQREVDGREELSASAMALIAVERDVQELRTKGVELTDKQIASLTEEALAKARLIEQERELGDILQNRAGDEKIIEALQKRILKQSEAVDKLKAEQGALDNNASSIERFIAGLQLSGDATSAQVEQFETLTQTLRELGIEFGNLRGEADKLRQMEQSAQQFNTTLANGFTNIVLSGGDAKDAIKNLYQQLIQLVLNQQILKLLQAGGGPSGGAGNFLAGLFGSANFNGGVFSGGSVQQYAKGGIPDFKELPDIGSNFSFFRSGDGKMNSIRERGPEAIMPLARDAQGRLGVRTAGGGGGPVSNTNTVNHVSNVTSYNVETSPDGFGLNSRQMERRMRRRRN